VGKEKPTRKWPKRESGGKLGRGENTDGLVLRKKGLLTAEEEKKKSYRTGFSEGETGASA